MSGNFIREDSVSEFKSHSSPDLPQVSNDKSSPSSSDLPPIAKTDEVSNASYKCHVCNTQFLAEDLLVQHVDDFPCASLHNQNGSEFRSQSSLDLSSDSNVDQESDSCSYICDVCKAQFSSEDLLDQHVIEHSNDSQAGATLGSKKSKRGPNKRNFGKQFDCPFCCKKFDFRYILRDHMRVHTGETPFECESCDRKFSHRNSLREHKATHDAHSAVDEVTEEGDARYECPKCSERFPAMAKLKTHLLVWHSVKSSFACTSCDAIFFSISHLRKHHDKCNPEKRFPCDLCDLRFCSKRSLQVHRSKHKAGERFECGVCEKKFPYEYQLRNHLPRHTREKNFECNKCGKMFSYKNSVRAHCRLVHGISSAVDNSEKEDLECHICGEKFRKKKALKAHLYIHKVREEQPFRCPVCDITFPYNHQLIHHLRTHEVGEQVDMTA